LLVVCGSEAARKKLDTGFIFCKKSNFDDKEHWCMTKVTQEGGKECKLFGQSSLGLQTRRLRPSALMKLQRCGPPAPAPTPTPLCDALEQVEFNDAIQNLKTDLNMEKLKEGVENMRVLMNTADLSTTDGNAQETFAWKCILCDPSLILTWS
jgi:hypothetical protein